MVSCWFFVCFDIVLWYAFAMSCLLSAAYSIPCRYLVAFSTVICLRLIQLAITLPLFLRMSHAFVTPVCFFSRHSVNYVYFRFVTYESQLLKLKSHLSQQHPLYVNKKSNHLSRIINNIPQSNNRRLSEILYYEESFNKAAPIYQKALNISGHTHPLTFSPQTPSQTTCKWQVLVYI